jgi:hypothetical protein
MRYRLNDCSTCPQEINEEDAMTQLTKEQLEAWAATRVRMLLARLIVLAMRGEKL